MQDIDLAADFGLYGKSDTDKDVPDFIGSQLGWTIVQFQDKFPNYYHLLKVVLGWSDADILARTYFTAAINEAGLLGYQSGAGYPFNRNPVKIPSGKWWYNSEMRCGRAIYQGAGADQYYGNGATEIAITKTNWKSIYGAGNDDTYLGFCPWTYPGEDGTAASPIFQYDWSHGFQIRDLCMTGSAGSFNDPSYREAGVNMHDPGENSGVFNCLFYSHNDFGVLVRGRVAPFRSTGCSFFYNGVAGFGICGAGGADIDLEFSGDFNPWCVYTFRQGEGDPDPGIPTGFNTSPNGVSSYWPFAINGTPGGNISIHCPKIESFACSPGYGMTTCPIVSGAYGKGQQLCRMTGRGKLNVYGGSMFVHAGKVNTLVQIVDDYYSGQNGGAGVPMANMAVDIQGLGPQRYAYWLHDTVREEKWQCDPTPNDPYDETTQTHFFWSNDDPTGVNPSTGDTYPVISAAWPYRQPFISDGQAIVWDETSGTAANYDPVTGAPL